MEREQTNQTKNRDGIGAKHTRNETKRNRSGKWRTRLICILETIRLKILFKFPLHTDIEINPVPTYFTSVDFFVIPVDAGGDVARRKTHAHSAPLNLIELSSGRWTYPVHSGPWRR